MLRLTEVLDHRVVDGAQFGKLARGIWRYFRKPAWLDGIVQDKLERCIFDSRDDLQH